MHKTRDYEWIVILSWSGVMRRALNWGNAVDHFEKLLRVATIHGICHCNFHYFQQFSGRFFFLASQFWVWNAKIDYLIGLKSRRKWKSAKNWSVKNYQLTKITSRGNLIPSASSLFTINRTWEKYPGNEGCFINFFGTLFSRISFFRNFAKEVGIISHGLS